MVHDTFKLIFFFFFFFFFLDKNLQSYGLVRGIMNFICDFEEKKPFRSEGFFRVGPLTANKQFSRSTT